MATTLHFLCFSILRPEPEPEPAPVRAEPVAERGAGDSEPQQAEELQATAAEPEGKASDILKMSPNSAVLLCFPGGSTLPGIWVFTWCQGGTRGSGALIDTT